MISTTLPAIIERPIIFSAPMIRALLDGRKTQTRRAVKPLPTVCLGYSHPRDLKWDVANGLAVRTDADCAKYIVAKYRCPYGRVGDRLWVRETWLPLDLGHYYDSGSRDQLVLNCGTIKRNGVGYCADMPTNPAHLKESNDVRRELGYKWQSPIFMPRWASRITLEITSIRVERVQDISKDDAKAEGIFEQRGGGTGPGPGFKWNGLGYHGAGFDRYKERTFHVPSKDGKCACVAAGRTPAQCAFQELWDSINAKKCPWSSNPWVWVIEFQLAASVRGKDGGD